MQILRIVNSSGHTSSPLNSFTLARSRLYNDEKTTFLSFSNNDLSAISLPETYKDAVCKLNQHRVEIAQADGNIFKFCRMVKNWAQDVANYSDRAIIQIHHPGSGFVFSLLCKHATKKIPIVYTVHNNYSNYALRHKLFMFFCFLIADKVTFVSNDSWGSFSNKLLGPSKSKSIVIQNGVDVDRIDSVVKGLPERSSVYENVLKVITIGRCIPQKNQKFLIDVFENIRGQWTLEIYGEGSLSEVLQEEINARNLMDKVSLKGVVPRDEVFKAIADCDIFVSPSLWEGLPVALMEAMCVGLPCIVSDISSHREVGGATEGVQLASPDVQVWRDQIYRLFMMSHEERRALGKKNREVIEKHFSVRWMQEQYRELYERLTAATLS